MVKDDYLPIVTKASYKGDYLIEVSFDNGVVKVVDCLPWLTGRIFEPLKEKGFFQTFFVDEWTIVWPNGADIAPETLYEADEVLLEKNSTLTA